MYSAIWDISSFCTLARVSEVLTFESGADPVHGQKLKLARRHEMTVTHDPVTADSQVGDSRARPWWVVALVAVAALVVGVAMGYVLGNDGGDTADPVTPGAVAVTERQDEMLALVDGFTDAWNALDVDASTEYMTPQATFHLPLTGLEYSVRDGSYQEMMAGLTEIGALIVDAPVYVAGDALIQVFQVPDQTLRIVRVFDFEERQDELLISAVVETQYLLEAEVR